MTTPELPVDSGSDEEYMYLSDTLVGDGKDLDAWLKETGFRTTHVPSQYEPTAPKNLGALTPEKLGELFDLFGEWFDYLIREEAMIANDLAKARSIERLTKRFVIEHKTPGPVTQREGKALLNRDVVYTMSVVARWQEKQRIINARIDSIQGTLRRISRHIALRDPSADIWLRGQNLGSGGRRYNADTSSEHEGKAGPKWGAGGLKPPMRPSNDDD